MGDNCSLCSMVGVDIVEVETIITSGGVFVSISDTDDVAFVDVDISIDVMVEVAKSTVVVDTIEFSSCMRFGTRIGVVVELCSVVVAVAFISMAFN